MRVVLASAAGAKHETLGAAKPQMFVLASAAGAKHETLGAVKPQMFFPV